MGPLTWSERMLLLAIVPPHPFVLVERAGRFVRLHDPEDQLANAALPSHPHGGVEQPAAESFAVPRWGHVKVVDLPLGTVAAGTPHEPARDEAGHGAPVLLEENRDSVLKMTTPCGGAGGQILMLQEGVRQLRSVSCLPAGDVKAGDALRILLARFN